MVEQTLYHVVRWSSGGGTYLSVLTPGELEELEKTRRTTRGTFLHEEDVEVLNLKVIKTFSCRREAIQFAQAYATMVRG